jgi:hypothetical protein
MENSTLVKKNSEKFEKNEKIVQEVLTQVSAIKNTNMQYQTDFMKILNEINEKIISQELMLEQLEVFEVNANKCFENLNFEFNKMNNSLKLLNEKKNNFNDRLNNIEDKSIPEFTKSCSKFKDDIIRIDGKIFLILVNIKALWDSLALFTSTSK